jgi:hypothetical protein
MTAFTHIPDPFSISWEPALAGELARFLRLEMWDVVWASIYWKLSALADVIGIVRGRCLTQPKPTSGEAFVVR